MNKELPNNVVFFGTPEPAVDIFEHLRQSGIIPKFVVTNPDKPQGRKMVLSPSPVKEWARKNNIPVFQPSRLDENFGRQLEAAQSQLFIVVAYGGIIPKEILEIPKYGSLNIHYSLLPKYRGASPVESQILNDDRDAGVSIMLLDEKLDHGPIIAQKRIKDSHLKNWPPTAQELRKICNETAGGLLVETIPLWLDGKIKAKEQDHSQATYTKKVTAEDRQIDLAGDPYENFLKIRAFAAWGTYFYTEKSSKKIRVSIKEAQFCSGRLIIVRVVPEGKKEMTYEDFLRGLRKE